MSRLQTRLERLEQQLPPCHACAGRPVQVELVSPQDGGRAGETRPEKPDPACPGCGEVSERILVLLNLDADAKAT